jgi:cytoskeletal protein CcmA (bactofilin family)
MIFKRQNAPVEEIEEIVEQIYEESGRPEDNVDTIVGPSVNVEGDFASDGNIIVKGTVTGSVNTTRNLLVETGAKIVANVKAGSATIAGEVRGNMKIKEYVELASTARIVGDIEAKTIVMEAGALLLGKVSMPGLEGGEARGGRSGRSRKSETLSPEIEE